MCDHRFYVCKHCGNLIGLIHSSGAPLICCGDPMTLLMANTEEASLEKHIPEVVVEGDTVHVTVGSVEHPMTEEHHIEWIYLQTASGGQRKCLTVGEAPKASFALKDDKLITVFAYCNLHGLWKKDV